MRDTLEAGVDRLQSEGLDSVDVVVIALADQPTIRVDVIAELLRVAIEHPGSAIVPTYEGKGGHPIVVPWGMLQKLSSLPRGVGLNALMKASDSSVVRWPIDDADILEDLDEPSDYDRHLGRPWSD
jgi:molybdenum cofactor cytidylyltransferase